MALNLNTSPYYDDFDVDKKFARILFKPGYAVQARELTQLQTILSDQIHKFSTFTFVDGTIISGCDETFNNIAYIKIDDTDAGSPSATVENLEDYIGDIISGGTTGIRAQILAVRDGLASSAPLTKTLYLKYISMGGATNSANLTHFGASEVLTVEATNANGVASANAGDTFRTLNTTGTESTPENYYYGFGNEIQLSPGIVFIDGKFVTTDKISTFATLHGELQRRYVGFLITESIVSSSDDASLLDPASGTYNFNAPGADRLKIEVTLDSYASGATAPDNFIRYVKVEENLVETTPVYGEDPLAAFGEILATYRRDSLGDYIVSGTKPSWREHLANNNRTNGGKYTLADGGDANKLVMEITSGKVVANGRSFPHQNKISIEVDKPQDTVEVDNHSLSTEFGSFVYVNELAGNWLLASGGLVELHDTAYTSATSGTYSSTTTSSSNLIGTARARALQYFSGNAADADTQYKLYLYDINIFGTNNKFGDVKSIVYQDTTAKGIADTVLEDLNNDGTPETAVLKEQTYKSLLWTLPEEAIETHTVTGNNFYYLKKDNATIGAPTPTLIFNANTAQNEQFDTGTSASSRYTRQVMISENSITVYMEDSSGTMVAIDPGQPIPLDDTYLASYTATTSKLTYTFRKVTSDPLGLVPVSCAVTVYLPVKKTSVNPLTKTLSENNYVIIDMTTHPNGTTGPFNLGFSDGYSLSTIRAFTTKEWNALADASFDLDVVGGEERTSDFYFDNGQRDSYYNHCSIEPVSSTMFAGYDKLVVSLNYFEHSATNPSGSYFTIDSYPVGTGDFQLQDVPIYYSNVRGRYDLRNCIDFRPRLTDTSVAADATTVSDAWDSGNGDNVNPLNVAEMEDPGAGIHIPLPTEFFVGDYSFYLRKAWKLVFDSSSNEYSVILSNSGLRPQIPPTPPRTMEIAKGRFSFYPTLSPQEARLSRRPDLATTIFITDNRGFTYKDIRALDTRIKALEKYVSLTLLEQQSESLHVKDADGVDRFKNGIFIDDFDDNFRSDINNFDYKAAVQSELSSMRPFFVVDKFAPEISDTGDTVAGTGTSAKIYTKSYVEVTYLEQLQASKTRNLLGMLLFHYSGKLEVTPRTNNSRLNSQRTAINQTFGDQNAAAISQIANSLGTVWGDWENNGNAFTQTISEGSWGNWERTGATGFISRDMNEVMNDPRVQAWLSDSTLITDPNNIPGRGFAVRQFTREKTDVVQDVQPQIRQGNTFSATTGTGGSVNFTAIEDISFNDFQQQKAITCQLRRMKPDTRLYAFYDDESVSRTTISSSDHLFYTNTNVNVKKDLITDSSGDLDVVFLIPANRFNTGVSILKFSDDEFNRTKFETTGCVATITSTTINTDAVDVTITEGTATVSVDPEPAQRRNNPVGVPRTETTTQTKIEFYDPVAQGFQISADLSSNSTDTRKHGSFVTSVDVWFREIDERANPKGVTCQLRTMANGYPAPTVLCSVYKPASELRKTPASGQNFTFDGYENTFTFERPIYLLPNVEYCFVFLPEDNNEEYEIWIAELGEDNLTEIGDTARNSRISSVNSSGTLFVSSNNTTWNAIQKEDLMFRVKTAQFATGDQTITFNSEEVDYVKVTNYTGALLAGQDFDALNVEITNVGAGYSSAPTITFSAPASGSTATGVATINNSGEVDSIRITNPGYGYTGNPTITFSGGSPSTPAQATAYRVKSVVDSIDLLNANIVLDRSVQTHATGVNAPRTAFRVAERSSIKSHSISSGGTDATRTLSTSYSNQAATGGTYSSTPTITATFDISVNAAGEATVTLVNPGLGYSVGDTIEIDSTVLGGSITLVIEVDRLDFSAITSLQSGSIVGRTSGYFGSPNTNGYVAEVEDRLVNASQVKFVKTTQAPTTVDLQLAFTEYDPDYKQISNNAVSTTFFDQDTDYIYEYQKEYNVTSRSNELLYFEGNRTFTGKIIFRHLDTNYTPVSPRVDFALFELFLTHNRLNNDSTGEDAASGGEAYSKWISQQVTLADGQDAEDLKVYLTMTKPLTNTVEVYAKLKAFDDDLSSMSSDIRWTKLDVESAPLKPTTESQEYVYTLPEFDGADDFPRGVNSSTGVFEYSIGRIGAIALSAGGSGYGTEQPKVIITPAPGDPGKGARAVAVVDAGGAVTRIDIVDGGRDYVSAPTVTLTGGSGTGATAGAATINDVLYSSFKQFQIKCVMLGENTYEYPLLEDIRAIALQV